LEFRRVLFRSKTTNIDSVPTVKNANDNIRSIGLSYMGYHGWLAKNQVAYDSKESVEIADIAGMILRYYSLKASNKIAIETQPYPEFSKSTYAKGEGLEQYTEEDYRSEEHTSELQSRFE